jgi:hypothetical protein
LCIIQFCCILYLLFLHQSIILDCATHEIEPFIEKSISIIHNNNKLKGVAVSLLLHQPTWFQLRYTMMIQNINANIPDDWKIQLFYVNQGTSKSGISINLGLKRFLKSGKLILTEIPEAMFKRKKRRIEFMLEPWIWQNMLADKVLIFGGTSVICSNSPLSLSNFTKFDYIGAPWDHFKGLGGDGQISFRNRNLMLKIIENELSYHENENGKKNRDEAYKSLVFRITHHRNTEKTTNFSNKFSDKRRHVKFRSHWGCNSRKCFCSFWHDSIGPLRCTQRVFKFMPRDENVLSSIARSELFRSASQRNKMWS